MKYTVNIMLILACLVSNAQELASYKLSDCDSDSYVELMRRRIVSKEIKGDTLTLKLGFTENCCLSPKPTIQSSNDTLFLSMENVSDLYCACDCCFEMETIVLNVKDTNFVLMWGEYEVKTQSKYPKLPHEYIIDENTPINKLNSDSLKVGLWNKYVESSGRKYEIFYDLNPTEKAIILWTRVYDKNGKLLEIGVKKERSGDLLLFEPYEYSNIQERLKSNYHSK